MSSQTKSIYNHLVIERMSPAELGNWLKGRNVAADVINILDIFDGTMFMNMSDSSIETLLKKVKESEKKIIILKTLRDSIISSKQTGVAAAAATPNPSRGKNFTAALNKKTLQKIQASSHASSEGVVVKKEKKESSSTDKHRLYVAIFVEEAFKGYKIPKGEEEKEKRNRVRRIKNDKEDPDDKGRIFNHLLNKSRFAEEMKIKFNEPFYEQVSKLLLKHHFLSYLNFTNYLTIHY
jgi:hypothetical protein